uniref:Ubiquitin-protein ligase n=1 Tax=Rhizophora mucronata TaxID=61149 RepID=A0A2P2LCL8_RHIMU
MVLSLAATQQALPILKHTMFNNFHSHVPTLNMTYNPQPSM